jgi:hypothetical protein
VLLRTYGRHLHADVRAILKDIDESGASTGWNGTVRRREALAEILARHDVVCVDLERGTWSKKPLAGGDPLGRDAFSKSR